MTDYLAMLKAEEQKSARGGDCVNRGKPFAQFVQSPPGAYSAQKPAAVSGAQEMSDIPSALQGPIARALEPLPFNVDAKGYEVDLVKSVNNWEEAPDGKLYLGRLANLSRGRAPTDLDSLRRELEDLFERKLAEGAAGRQAGTSQAGGPTSGQAGQVAGGQPAPPTGAE